MNTQSILLIIGCLVIVAICLLTCRKIAIGRHQNLQREKLSAGMPIASLQIPPKQIAPLLGFGVVAAALLSCVVAYCIWEYYVPIESAQIDQGKAILIAVLASLVGGVTMAFLMFPALSSTTTLPKG